jgi:hypothetical protein
MPEKLISFRLWIYRKKNSMNTPIKTLGIFALLPLLVVSCNLGADQTQAEQQSTPKVTPYEVLLGNSLTDIVVADFIASNKCAPAGEFQLCKDVGMALWTDSDLAVNTVYLYSGNVDGFRRYRGKLPFGLSFYDPMWRVEHKLSELDADGSLEPTLMAGFPDEASSPDHMHYWAVYKRMSMTVVYNSPGADEDAYIYAILVHSSKPLIWHKSTMFYRHLMPGVKF